MKNSYGILVGWFWLSKLEEMNGIASSIYMEVNDDEKWEELWANRTSQASFDQAKRVTWNASKWLHNKCNSYQNAYGQLVKHV